VPYVCVSDCVTDVRQSLAVPRLISKSDAVPSVGGSASSSGLGELLRQMHSSLVSQLKSVLIHLQVSTLLSSQSINQSKLSVVRDVVIFACFLCQGAGHVIRSVCVSVTLFVCVQDYCESNQPISLKLRVVIGPTKSEELILTFGVDPSRIQIPDHFFTSFTIVEEGI